MKAQWIEVQKIAVFSLIALSGVIQASDLRRELTPDQFKAAGLHKLSQEELSKLNELVLTHQAMLPAEVEQPTETAAVSAASERAFAAPAASAAPVPSSKPWEAQEKVSPIEGDRLDTEVSENFSGSRTGTKIKLINGQVWEQVDSTPAPGGLKNRQVVIQPGWLGSWKLRFKQNNVTVRVRRIK